MDGEKRVSGRCISCGVQGEIRRVIAWWLGVCKHDGHGQAGWWEEGGGWEGAVGHV